MDMTIIEVMTATEAEHCLNEIRAHFDSAAALAKDFEDRRGWAALGYDDLRSCLIDRFNRHGYRLWRLYEVRDNIQALGDGETGDELRERHVRESGILDLTPDQQVEAYRTAKQMAEAECTKLTATHVTQAVASVKTKATVFQSNYMVVTHMVVSGNITAEVGTQFVSAIDKLKPKQRGHIIQLMVKFGMTCPALVEPIANMFDRPPGKESYVLPDVLRGFLGGTALKAANLTDLANANEEARRQHLQDQFDKQQQGSSVVPQIITVYQGDPQRTLAALRAALGIEVYRLRDLLMAE